MKKLFLLVALMFGLASCQNEPEGLNVSVGEEQEVMLNVSLPESTRSASSTGFDFTDFQNNGDYDLRFILEISHNGKTVREVKTTETTNVTFPIRLAAGRAYTFTVWADLVTEGTDTDLYYDTTEGLANIKVNLDKWTPNIEARDAYTLSMSKEFNAMADLSMELKRPFAKVRVVATDIKKITDFDINPTSAAVKYSKNMYTTFNAITGVTGAAQEIGHTFLYADVDTYKDNTGERTLFADYIFVPEDNTVQFSLNVYADKNRNDLIKKNNFNTAILVEKNRVTSIVGDILTEGGNVKITVDSDLDHKETYNYVDSANSLQETINKIEEGESGNIRLGGDIVLGASASTSATRAATRDYIYIAEGQTVVFDLNGFSISHSNVKNKYAFNNNGTLIIKDSKGGGSINARGIYNGYGEGSENVTTAKIIVESGVINAMGENGGAAIYNYGEVEIKGGKFESNGGYGLNNQTNGSMVITGGEIRGGIYNCGTLNINGENISVYQHLSGKHTIYNWAATTTIENGSFDSESGNELILADGENCTVVINGGTFDKSGKSWLMGAATGKNITFTINGGTFRGYVNMPEQTVDTFRPYNDPIVVYGGIFNFDPTQWLSDDHTARETENGYVVERKPAVAKIGEAEYTTLIKAVAAVKEGETITLVANEKFTENNRSHNSGTWYDGLYYVGDKSFTIDLGGYTISQDGAVNDYLLNFKNTGSKANTITIKNGIVDAGTAAYCALCTSSVQENQLTINLENVTLYNNISNGSTVKIRGGAILNVNAGTKIIGKNSYLGIECVGATVNIYDGAELYMNGKTSYNGCLAGVGYGGTINVFGGYGKGVKGGFIAMTSGGTINISGGEWIANTDGTVGSDSNWYVLTAQSNKYESGFVGGAYINVTGGTFRGGMDAWVLNNIEGEEAKISICGGNYNVNPTRFLVEGYEANNIDGIWSVRVAPVAKIGNVEYETLEAAVAAAKAGDTITLLKDVKPANLPLLKDITLDGNGQLIDATIDGDNLTIAGHIKVTLFNGSNYNRNLTILEGGCLEVTSTNRISLGFGNTWTVTGSIKDAKTADKANIKPSLIIPGGVSITGGYNATLNVTNAYVKFGNTSSKNSSANGEFTLNFNNSIVDFTNQFTFAEPTSGKTPKFNLNIKDSVLTTATKLCMAASGCNTVIDNSNVTIGTYIRNSGNVEIKNGSVVTGSTIQFGENGGNNGAIRVDASSLTINASAAGHALDGKGEGSITATNGAEVLVTYYKDMTISVDETSSFTGTEVE